MKYIPQTKFIIDDDGRYNLVYNLRENKDRRMHQPEMINDVTISLSNNHHLTKEQMQEIAETICEALNKKYMDNL